MHKIQNTNNYVKIFTARNQSNLWQLMQIMPGYQEILSKPYITGWSVASYRMHFLKSSLWVIMSVFQVPQEEATGSLILMPWWEDPSCFQSWGGPPVMELASGVWSLQHSYTSQREASSETWKRASEEDCQNNYSLPNKRDFYHCSGRTLLFRLTADSWLDVVGHIIMKSGFLNDKLDAVPSFCVSST